MLWLALVACVAAQSPDDLDRAYREKVARIEQSRPAKDGPALEAWLQSRLDADWEHGIALLRLAEERRSPDPYRRAIRHFTEYLWKWDGQPSTLQVMIFTARAHEALQEWGPCFAMLRKARCLDQADLRRDPQIIDLAVRSWTQELRLRVDTGRGIRPALENLRNDLKLLPAKQEDEPFLSFKVETARALHAAGRAAEAEGLLRDLATRHGQTDAGFRAIGLLADLFQKDPDAVLYADQLFQRHHFTEAAVYYGRAARTPLTWFRLGLCYQNLRRLHEAAVAFQQVCAAPGPHAAEAALRLLRILQKLLEIEPADTLRARLAAHREWMTRSVDLAQAGPTAARLLADGLAEEGKYREAAELYAKIKPDQKGYAEAVHSLGLCRFKLKEYDRAAAEFERYLGLEKRTPRASDSAFHLACWSLLASEKAQKALDLTEGYAPADPVIGDWRKAHRVDALGRLGRFREARETLDSMKQSAASRPLVRAIECLAAAYEQEIARTGDRRLWGPYARLVVGLSEVKSQPLRGEKLLAAADALALEETPESHALACDLYGRYLAESKAGSEELREVERRRARSALGAGRLEKAREIVREIRLDAPLDGNATELEADIAAAQAAKLPRGAERSRLLDEAMRLYAGLMGDRGGGHFNRLAWKYATQLFAREPDRARSFFEDMERRGYREWGEYQERMRALRSRIFEAVPPRR